MKISMIVLVLLTISNFCVAQKLSISKMLEYYNEIDWQNTNIDLMSMGWRFDSVTPGNEEDNSYNIIMWTFGAKNYMDVVRLYTWPGYPSRVIFATLNIEAYKEIRAELNKYNFVLMSEEYGDYISSTNYENNFYDLEISLTNMPRGISYGFTLNAK